MTKSIAASALQPPVSDWLNERPTHPSASSLVGQQRAQQAIAQLLESSGRYAHGYIITPPGLRVLDVMNELSETHTWRHSGYYDWLYLANPDSAHQPLCVNVPAGQASIFLTDLWELLNDDKGQRQQLVAELTQRYPSERIANYLTRLGDKTFADLPGAELASIIVQQNNPAAFQFCDRVTEASLFGSIRLQSVQGTISSDLHLIEAGAILEANGGVLVIDAEALLLQQGLWRKLKYILRTSLFHWPQPGDTNIAAYYEPEPIPIHIKVVLHGDRDIYAQLREVDRDFDNLFPYLADFSTHFSVTEQPLQHYFDYLAYVERESAVLPLAQSAIPILLKFVSRLTDYQSELSLDTIAIMQFLREANVLAEQAKASELTAEHLLEVMRQRQHRNGYIADLSRRAMLEGQVYIATSGHIVGQINGLTVVSAGGSEFGEPTRITATVHYGDGDIIDIDRKSELSGSIHTKGVMILSAYLANVFARNDTMSLSATIVFEQSYHEVDGDSASLAELCCLLSALADAPIDQGLAITGAVDQFGRVQAIGAVNEKIEGYFSLCEARGLTGTQGVIIPAANVCQLNLAAEVIAAVEQKQFHVYAVEHVKEALELLTHTEQQALYRDVQQRLNELREHDLKPAWWRRLVGLV